MTLNQRLHEKINKWMFIGLLLLFGSSSIAQKYKSSVADPVGKFPREFNSDGEKLESFAQNLWKKKHIQMAYGTAIPNGWKIHVSFESDFVENTNYLKEVNLYYFNDGKKSFLTWVKVQDKSQKHPVKMSGNMPMLLGFSKDGFALYSTDDSKYLRSFKWGQNPNTEEPEELWILLPDKDEKKSVELLGLSNVFPVKEILDAYGSNFENGLKDISFYQRGVGTEGKYACSAEDYNNVKQEFQRMKISALINDLRRRYTSDATPFILKEYVKCVQKNGNDSSDEYLLEFKKTMKEILVDDIKNAPQDYIRYKAILSTALEWIEGKASGQQTLLEISKGTGHRAVAAQNILRVYCPILIEAGLEEGITPLLGEDAIFRAEKLLGAKHSDAIGIRVKSIEPLVSTLEYSEDIAAGTVKTETWHTIPNPAYMNWLNRLEAAEKELIAAGGQLASAQYRAANLRTKIKKTYVAVEGSYVHEVTTRSGVSAIQSFAANEEKRFRRSVLQEKQSTYDFLLKDPPPKTIRSKQSANTVINLNVQDWRGIVSQKVQIERFGKDPVIFTAVSRDASIVIEKRVSPSDGRHAKTISMSEAMDKMLMDMGWNVRKKLNTLAFAQPLLFRERKLLKEKSITEKRLDLYLLTGQYKYTYWRVFDMSVPIATSVVGD